MKKIFAILVSFILILSLGACSSSEEKTYDNQFLKDLSKGLMMRWDTQTEQDETEETYYNRLVDGELEYVSQYADKKFEDLKLQERAIAYINLLNMQKDALTYYSADYSRFSKMWEQAYNDRTQAIKVFIDEYDIKFNSKYDEIVSSIASNAKAADESDLLEEKVSEMVSMVNFKKVKTSYSYSYYEYIIENITDKTFSSFSLDINLLDADGVIVDTEYVYVNNFSPKQKAKLEFSTDVKFEKYEITADYYID